MRASVVLSLVVLLPGCGGPEWTDPLPPGTRRPIAGWVAPWRAGVYESVCAGRDASSLRLEIAQSPAESGLRLGATLTSRCHRGALWALRLEDAGSCGGGCDLVLMPRVERAGIDAWRDLEQARRRLGGPSLTGTVVLPPFDATTLSRDEFEVLASSSAVRRGELFTGRSLDRIELARALEVEVFISSPSPRGALALRVTAGESRALLAFDLDPDAQRALLRQVCVPGRACEALRADVLGVTLPAGPEESPLDTALLRAAQPRTVVLATGPAPDWDAIGERVRVARHQAHQAGAELVSLHETGVVASRGPRGWVLELDPMALR